MLKLVWKAYYKNGETVSQFDDHLNQTKQNSFKQAILNKQSELSKLCLFNVQSGKTYTADLVGGTLHTGEHHPGEKDQLREMTDVRVIYFRRWEHQFTTQEHLSSKVSYFLGLQYKENNVAHKNLIQIFEDDTLVIYS